MSKKQKDKEAKRILEDMVAGKPFKLSKNTQQGKPKHIYQLHIRDKANTAREVKGTTPATLLDYLKQGSSGDKGAVFPAVAATGVSGSMLSNAIDAQRKNRKRKKRGES